MPKRDKWRIYLDILKVISRNENCSKTKAMQLSNLSWRSFSKHFMYLSDNNFLENDCDSVKNYSLTKKGEELLSKLVSVAKILEET